MSLCKECRQQFDYHDLREVGGKAMCDDCAFEVAIKTRADDKEWAATSDRQKEDLLDIIECNARLERQMILRRIKRQAEERAKAST
jgi:DNA-directed RNA polymerase subunit RPC12/RpoP